MGLNNDLLIAVESKGQVLEWIKVLPLGLIDIADATKPFEVQLGDMERVIQNFAVRGELAMEYDFQPLLGCGDLVAGWVKELAIRKDGLYARLEWTDTARQRILAGEYSYFSPVLLLDQRNRRPHTLWHVGIIGSSRR